MVHCKELQSELTSRTENIALMLSIPVGQRGIDEGGLLFMVELRPDQMSKLLIVDQISAIKKSWLQMTKWARC